jgi:hypothetical protein
MIGQHLEFGEMLLLKHNLKLKNGFASKIEKKCYDQSSKQEQA